MAKSIVLILLVLCSTKLNAQIEYSLDSLFSEIVKHTSNSKNIIQSESTQIIINDLNDPLEKLSKFILDTTEVNIFSDCQSRNISKGELAIILMDHIERIPYHIVFGIQNCLRLYCEENLNFVEYYFNWNQLHSIQDFSNNYQSWLKSKDRRKWLELMK